MPSKKPAVASSRRKPGKRKFVAVGTLVEVAPQPTATAILTEAPTPAVQSALSLEAKQMLRAHAMAAAASGADVTVASSAEDASGGSKLEDQQGGGTESTEVAKGSTVVGCAEPASPDSVIALTDAVVSSTLSEVKEREVKLTAEQVDQNKMLESAKQEANALLDKIIKQLGDTEKHLKRQINLESQSQVATGTNRATVLQKVVAGISLRQQQLNFLRNQLGAATTVAEVNLVKGESRIVGWVASNRWALEKDELGAYIDFISATLRLGTQPEAIKARRDVIEEQFAALKKKYEETPAGGRSQARLWLDHIKQIESKPEELQVARDQIETLGEGEKIECLSSLEKLSEKIKSEQALGRLIAIKARLEALEAGPSNTELLQLMEQIDELLALKIEVPVIAPKPEVSKAGSETEAELVEIVESGDPAATKSPTTPPAIPSLLNPPAELSDHKSVDEQAAVEEQRRLHLKKSDALPTPGSLSHGAGASGDEKEEGEVVERPGRELSSIATTDDDIASGEETSLGRVSDTDEEERETIRWSDVDKFKQDVESAAIIEQKFATVTDEVKHTYSTTAEDATVEVVHNYVTGETTVTSDNPVKDLLTIYVRHALKPENKGKTFHYDLTGGTYTEAHKKEAIAFFRSHQDESIKAAFARITPQPTTAAALLKKPSDSDESVDEAKVALQEISAKDKLKRILSNADLLGKVYSIATISSRTTRQKFLEEYKSEFELLLDENPKLFVEPQCLDRYGSFVRRALDWGYTDLVKKFLNLPAEAGAGKITHDQADKIKKAIKQNYDKFVGRVTEFVYQAKEDWARYHEGVWQRLQLGFAYKENQLDSILRLLNSDTVLILPSQIFFGEGAKQIGAFEAAQLLSRACDNYKNDKKLGRLLPELVHIVCSDSPTLPHIVSHKSFKQVKAKALFKVMGVLASNPKLLDQDKEKVKLASTTLKVFRDYLISQGRAGEITLAKFNASMGRLNDYLGKLFFDKDAFVSLITQARMQQSTQLIGQLFQIAIIRDNSEYCKVLAKHVDFIRSAKLETQQAIFSKIQDPGVMQAMVELEQKHTPEKDKQIKVAKVSAALARIRSGENSTALAELVFNARGALVSLLDLSLRKSGATKVYELSVDSMDLVNYVADHLGQGNLQRVSIETLDGLCEGIMNSRLPVTQRLSLVGDIAAVAANQSIVKAPSDTRVFVYATVLLQLRALIEPQNVSRSSREAASNLLINLAPVEAIFEHLKAKVTMFVNTEEKEVLKSAYAGLVNKCQQKINWLNEHRQSLQPQSYGLFGQPAYKDFKTMKQEFIGLLKDMLGLVVMPGKEEEYAKTFLLQKGSPSVGSEEKHRDKREEVLSVAPGSGV